MFVAALVTIAKPWKQPKSPSAEEWRKMWCVCVYIIYNGVCVCILYVMEYYSAIKNETMPFAATWMDLEIITLRQRKTNMILLDVESKKKMDQMNLFTEWKQPHRLQKQTSWLPKGKRGGEG